VPWRALIQRRASGTLTAMSGPSDAKLELLLAEGPGHPALGVGLAEGVAALAPRPARTRADALYLSAPDADPGDLSLQRWGIIAPEGAEGDAALDALQPLIEMRLEEQGSTVSMYRVPAQMGPEDAVRWRDARLAEKDDLDRPRYLLVLGDFDQVPLELQYALASTEFVGRLCFREPAGYHAYAQKVVDATKNAPPTRSGQALFFAAADDTSATGEARRTLLSPCMARLSSGGQRSRDGSINVVDLGGVHTPADLIHASRNGGPAMLLTVTHGLARPPGDWSADERRARQGALVIGKLGDVDGVLDAASVAHGPALPGGVWICVSSFAGGTPAQSAFAPWLSLVPTDEAAHLARVTACTPQRGDAPFVAALPQALLANPEGPLAVISKADLAWVYGEGDAWASRSTSVAERISSVFRALARGARVGVAFDAMTRAYLEANDELMADFQAEEDARVWNRPSPSDPARRARGFMRRSDLRGYILLGDPAARF